MAIVTEPMTVADFDVLEAQWDSPQGELCAPALNYFWPVDYTKDPKLAQSRAKWNHKQSKEIFFQDPSAYFVKAVEVESGEIIALARWHYYERGYQHPEFTPWELNGRAPDADSTWPQDFGQLELHKAFLNVLFDHRQNWAGDHPQWVLTTLITRHGHRKKGAGFLLSEWGVKQAQKHGVPAYVEASKDGVPVYKKAGFHEVDKLYFDSLPEHLNLAKGTFVTLMAANTGS